MQFNRGYLSAYFVTDPERLEVVLEDPYILIHEKKISHLKDLLPVLERASQRGHALLVTAEDVEGEGWPQPNPGGHRTAEPARRHQERVCLNADKQVLPTLLTRPTSSEMTHPQIC